MTVGRFETHRTDNIIANTLTTRALRTMASRRSSRNVRSAQGENTARVSKTGYRKLSNCHAPAMQRAAQRGVFR